MTRYGSFHVMTECGQCGQPVPINGPLLKVECSHCFFSRTIAPDSLLDIFESLEEEYSGLKEGQGSGERVMGGDGVFKYTYLRRLPQCGSCKTPMEVDSVETGAEQDLVCGNCKVITKTFPAPKWLQERMPQAVQCFGGEQECLSEATPLELEQSIPKAIAMACPSCGGGLSVTGEWQRTHPCSYCRAEIFIPDALWKRLHPIKTARHWGLRFEGRSTQQLASDAKEQASESKLRDLMATPLPTKFKPLCIRYVEEAMASDYDAEQVEASLAHIENVLHQRVNGKAVIPTLRRLLEAGNGERVIRILESGGFMRIRTLVVVPLVVVAVAITALLILLP